MVRTAAAARVAALARSAAPAAGGNRHRSHLPQVGAACLPLRMQCLNWPEDCSCSCGSGRLLLQLRQCSVLTAVPAHHHHQPPQALAMLSARARAPSTIACLLTLACCLLPGGALLGAAPPACRQEAMDPDRVATCLDSIISHCKDLTRTGCFGGWSSKLEEVGAGAAAPPGALGSRAALVSGATATPQLPAHSRAPPALPRPSAHAVPLSPPPFPIFVQI